eukprot:3448434-Pyramimonas_sp.AAC.2
MQAKSWLSSLQRRYPGRDWRLLRARSLISADTVSIVEVLSQGANEATKLAWSPAGTAQFGIHILQMAGDFRQQLSGVDTSAWALSQQAPASLGGRTAWVARASDGQLERKGPVLLESQTSSPEVRHAQTSSLASSCHPVSRSSW